MKRLLLLIAFLPFSKVFSTPPDTVVIKTSAVCGTCKKTIEKDLSFEKGVRSADLDVDTKMLTVVYDENKTTPDKIRHRVAKIGYDSDDLQKDPKGFKRLPDCCKKECISH